MNLEAVKNYYGKVLKSSEDLKTSACCDGGGVPSYLELLLANVHEEVRAKYYGCGIIVPAALEGTRVLDLGSGSGRDVYMIAQLVGPNGEVVGVDMTDEQLATAEAHSDWHMRRFGFARPNVRFLKGYIERLEELGLEPASFDVIVSNCVINLSIDKSAVLRGAYDLLKPGGELYFADVYCDRRLPDSVRADPVLYGECLGGALYWNDFLPMAKRAGFLDPRLVTSKPLDIKNEAMKRKIGQAKSFPRRIAYSSSMGSSRPAKITGRPSSTKAVCPTSRMHSSSTVTILSRRARSSRCAAIPGACSPIRGSHRISI
jgi:arsenite methyltransferase